MGPLGSSAAGNWIIMPGGHSASTRANRGGSPEPVYAGFHSAPHPAGNQLGPSNLG
jgi:hypothetical protein